VTPVRKRAWLNACEALRQYVDTTDDAADFFYTDDFRMFPYALQRFDMYPFAVKYGYTFDTSTMRAFAEGRRYHVFVSPSREVLIPAEPGRIVVSPRYNEAVDRAAVDMYDITAAPIGLGRTLSRFIGDVHPNMHSNESFGSAKQRILDDVLPRGFSFTYKGRRYHAKPGLVNVCLDLTPETDDPDVLEYLDVVTPIWVVVNDLPENFDPYKE
jgi:hypothetical protein